MRTITFYICLFYFCVWIIVGFIDEELITVRNSAMAIIVYIGMVYISIMNKLEDN